MSKGNTFETELLSHILENADIADIGDATGLRGSTTAGSLYISLHTADPGEAGNQTSSEIAYTGYARVAVSRAGASWNVSGGSATNAAEVAFGACTAGSGTATYFAVGTSSSGTGKLLYSGLITTPASGLAISAGITPRFAADQLTISED